MTHASTLVASGLFGLHLLLVLQPILLLASAANTEANTDAADACSTLPAPSSLDTTCQAFATWDDFAAYLPTARDALILCAGSRLTRPNATSPRAIIKHNLRLLCSVPGKCRIRGPGRHLTIKTGPIKRVVVDGIHFENGDFTSVVIVDDAAGQHTFCGNTFASNARPVDSAKGGGAIYAGRNTNIVIGGGSVFRNNEARLGGAISFAGTSLVIVDTTFVDNVAAEGGGVVEASLVILPATTTDAAAAETATVTTPVYVPPQRIEIGTTTFIDNSASTDDGGSASGAVLLASGGEWVDLGGNSVVFGSGSGGGDTTADTAIATGVDGDGNGNGGTISLHGGTTSSEPVQVYILLGEHFLGLNQNILISYLSCDRVHNL